MLKKFFSSFLFFVFIFFSIYASICYAETVAVTDANLNEALQKFVTSEANEENYNITVSNNVINVKVDNESYNINYDLTGKPTFWYEATIEKGMSYENFKNQTDALVLPMLGYVGVAEIQGVKAKDAMGYFMFSYLGSALNGSFSSEDSYVIVDDLNLSEGVTMGNTDDSKTIYTSEFGDRVMEYVNQMYKEKQTVSDSTGINSYMLTIEKKDSTDTSCKLVSKVTVNTEADFSQIKGYTDELESSFLGGEVTKENADYVIELKVGQKCKIETNEKVTGYSIVGGSSIEIDKDAKEIIGLEAGESRGYLTIGDKEKSIYVIVEENTQNDSLDTITLEIDKVDNQEIEDNEQEEQENVNDVNSRLPQTGVNNLIFIIMMIFSGLAIINAIKFKNINK